MFLRINGTCMLYESFNYIVGLCTVSLLFVALENTFAFTPNSLCVCLLMKLNQLMRNNPPVLVRLA